MMSTGTGSMALSSPCPWSGRSNTERGWVYGTDTREAGPAGVYRPYNSGSSHQRGQSSRPRCGLVQRLRAAIKDLPYIVAALQALISPCRMSPPYQKSRQPSSYPGQVSGSQAHAGIFSILTIRLHLLQYMGNFSVFVAFHILIAPCPHTGQRTHINSLYSSFIETPPFPGHSRRRYFLERCADHLSSASFV